MKKLWLKKFTRRKVLIIKKNSDEENSDEENKLFLRIYKERVNSCYLKHKERLLKEEREMYQNLSEEEKDKSW